MTPNTPTSILFIGATREFRLPITTYHDLNINQIVRAFLIGREEYRLESWFSIFLTSVEAITFRHEVWHDLQSARLRDGLTEVADQLRLMRKRLAMAQELRVPRQRQAALLEASEIYVRAVRDLLDVLTHPAVQSVALTRFRGFLADYCASADFIDLSAQTARTRSALSSVEYVLHIRANRIGVAAFSAGEDYSSTIDDLFARFRSSDTQSPIPARVESSEMNHIEAALLDLVAEVETEPFIALATFWNQHRDFLRPEIVLFDREAQFYLCVCESCHSLHDTALAFSLPDVTRTRNGLFAEGLFDWDLALEDNGTSVTNDIELGKNELVLIVTGANQGGKTTFARAFGQLNALAALGLPVPARRAAVPLCDGVFTLFERQEDPEAQTGALENELIRMREILDRATPSSVIVLNEPLSTTSIADARVIGEDLIIQIITLGAACLCVTFIDELSELSPAVVSMVAEVDARHPDQRTFRFSRRPADGRAHALSVAARYGLTFDRVRERITQ